MKTSDYVALCMVTLQACAVLAVGMILWRQRKAQARYDADVDAAQAAEAAEVERDRHLSLVVPEFPVLKVEVRLLAEFDTEPFEALVLAGFTQAAIFEAAAIVVHDGAEFIVPRWIGGGPAFEVTEQGQFRLRHFPIAQMCEWVEKGTEVEA